MLDALGLVVLDDHVDLLGLIELQHGADAIGQQLAVVQHGAGVGGDVGLALGAIDADVVHLLGLDVQLYRGGEAGAAEAHRAAGADGVHKALEIRDLRGGEPLVGLLQAVSLDDDAHAAGTVEGGDLLHLFHGAGHAGVDGSGHEAARLCDELPHLHDVSRLDHRLCRRANVHGHRDGDHSRHGHPLGDAADSAFLVMGQPDSVQHFD